MRAIFRLVRNLGLGLLLIGLAAGVLLYSDLGSRERQRAVARQAPETRMLQIAVVQHASLDALDDGVRGIVDGLQARGYAEGDRLRIRRYNAEADMATANTIAREVISQNFDLIVSVSTPSLQTIANANRTLSSPHRHVFGVSSDPYGAGVGISRDDHFEHPPYMAGIGSMPPVEDAFRLMQELNPEATRIGLVWNPAEANSVAATELARRVAAELGLELVEANAENSTAAGEAAASLTSRGIDALWISPDVTTITAARVLIETATRARVPAFTSVPGHADQGALFDVGGDYYQIGILEGHLAADILDGTDASSIPIENIMPIELHVNTPATEGLRDTWVVPESVRDRAQILIDDSGRHVRDQSVEAAAPDANRPNQAASKPQTIDLIEYADTPNADVSREGVADGLAAAGLSVGSDFTLRRHTAQGDIATLTTIVDNVMSQQTDLIIALSTPALQATLQRARATPIVFGMVSNPFIIGAGTSDSDHLPYVTGAYLSQPLDEIIATIELAFPEARRIGTLFTPAEINSEFNMRSLEDAALESGYEFEKLGIATVTDIADAGIALASLDLDVWVQVSDNLIASSFSAIVEASRRADLPLISFSPAAADLGALIVVARDYYDTGVEAGRIAARVLRGESPASIDFASPGTSRLMINLATAAAYGIELPQELLDRADRIVE